MKFTVLGLITTAFLTIGCVPPTLLAPRAKPTTILVSPVESKEGTYSDDALSVRMTPAAIGVDMVIKNSSTKVMTINWDKCAIVGIDGVSMRVIHAGVKFVNKEQAQTPTIVPPDSQVTEPMIPSVLITLDDIYGWRHADMFKASDVNGFFTVLLAVEFDGQPKNYLFKFKLLALA